jgi:hypothetical protein
LGRPSAFKNRLSDGRLVGPQAKARLNAAFLALALLFVVAVAYLPHMDVANDARTGRLEPGLVGLGQTYGEWATGDRDDYEYTLHVDENHHWAMMAQLQRQDTLGFDNPYNGQSPTGIFQIKGSVHKK